VFAKIGCAEREHVSQHATHAANVQILRIIVRAGGDSSTPLATNSCVEMTPGGASPPSGALRLPAHYRICMMSYAGVELFSDRVDVLTVSSLSVATDFWQSRLQAA